MPSLILTTVGTSILTNTAPSDARNRLVQLANRQVSELSAEDIAFIDEIAANVPTCLAAGPVAARNASAEISGLMAWYEGRLQRSAGDTHYLLHTDTYQGRRSAELIAGWLSQSGIHSQVEVIRNLRTAEPDEFRHAMAALAVWVAETCGPYRGTGTSVVFHLSGGFKSVLGFLQTAGMFYADEVVYLFERSQHLMRIPRLPIDLAQVMRDTITAHVDVFRRLATLTIIPAAETSGLPELCIDTDGDDAALTPWGELCWRQVRDELYRKALLPPPHPRIRFTKTFEHTVAALSAERRGLINQRIDQFASYLGNSGRPNPASLDFKPLRGGPHLGGTHECDAWADADAQRIFMHLDGEHVWVIDALGRKLR